MASRALRASAHPLDALRAQRATQSEQESALRRTVSTATALRDAAAADVRALEYVSDLTRDETARRRQGNQHLARAYSGSGSASIPSIDSEGAVQRAEAALLLAKAELAALRLSIDELHARRARAARTRASTHRRATNAFAGSSSGSTGAPLARSPRTMRHGGSRLIADVDAIVSVNGAHAPARVGVAPAGALALLGYGGSEPVRRLAGVMVKGAREELSMEDEQILRERLLIAPVQTAVSDDAPRVRASVVGISEALFATRRVINSTSAATRVVDEMLPPRSPRSPRRRRT